jgi:dTDP-4-dehydrorhamnose 3,5-epimerase
VSDRRPDWSGAAPEILREDDGDAPRKDPQLATQDQGPIKELIDGVRVRAARTIPDHRGSICVMLDPRWEVDEMPIVYTYWVTIRPGAVKGWILHETYDDRLFLASGAVRWVLYDDREGSATRGRLNEFFFDAHNRSLLRIPRGVWHAVQNVGSSDSVMVNHPTEPYDYENPDKTRLPIDTDRIPFTF